MQELYVGANRCEWLKHVWYFTSFILEHDVLSSMDVVQECFGFSIFVIRLCRARMICTRLCVFLLLWPRKI